MRRELVRVSPVVNAAEKRRVASIRPITIKAVCALRRGTFRAAILKATRSPRARKARIKAPTVNIARRTELNCPVGIPKSSVIVRLLAAGFIALDHAVAHSHQAVGAAG